MTKDKLKIMVSSSVYGYEELLHQIYTILSKFGYEVWISDKGTVRVWPNMTNFKNCHRAVEECDLFLSIITPRYGSGKEDKNAMSITHQELLTAIENNKPRWILAHDHVVFARNLLNNLGYNTKKKREQLKLKKTGILEDLRVIDMYELAIRHDLTVYQDRKGNWVQKFYTNDDAKLFTTSQFHRYDEVKNFLKHQFYDINAIDNAIKNEVPK